MDQTLWTGESYCGPAPTPAALWSQWNLDPILVAALIAAAIAMVRLTPGDRMRRLAGLGGIATLAIAFISPLCALTVALFSARVFHHVLLVTVAAPLLALALRPWLGRAGTLMMPLLLLHTLVFWIWHAPDAYALALSNTAAYWLMQISLLGTAALLWGAILNSQDTGRSLLALLGTTIQMGFLGALLVFANDPLYLPHVLTTGAFGLDPVSDQQLGGLLMWVPASLPYLGVALYQVFVALSRTGAAGAR
jgi:putative membrane protein